MIVAAVAAVMAVIGILPQEIRLTRRERVDTRGLRPTANGAMDVTADLEHDQSSLRKTPAARVSRSSMTPATSRNGRLQSKRAIVPMDGWFEWTGEKGAKVPHFIHHPDGQTLGVAGLYSWWLDRSKPEDDDMRWMLTATILTSDAVDELVGIHDRSPVPLPRELWDWWLDPSLVGDQAMVDDAVKAALPIAEQLDVYSVRPFKVGQDGPALIEPAE
ncbi:SOS response-associated peptidase [Agromyces sp. S2-1-8]|uniref:SOS response-associated peptidase n=1 Tax=Agromyces sp. S2-1-8 TaxID=2897180 RepID=UPI001E2897D9|nr:SOS response-associated peptidase family protein [Agromyces sp. S2-1-8]MCD5348394.1 SOS response-associated peptidase [Agromyces sp. S2-1-8]